MKTIAIASILALAAITAGATEVSLTAGNSAGTTGNGFGVSVSQKYVTQTVGAVDVIGAIERSSQGEPQTRTSVAVSKDLTKFGPVTVSANTGVAYLSNATSENGYAMTVGAAATVPVTKGVNFVVGVGRQYGQVRVSAFDGARVTAGVSYSF